MTPITLAFSAHSRAEEAQSTYILCKYCNQLMNELDNEAVVLLHVSNLYLIRNRSKYFNILNDT